MLLDRPSWIDLVEQGKTYHVGFDHSGRVIQVDWTVSKKKKGETRVTLWRRGGGEKPISDRTAVAIERAIAAREQAKRIKSGWSYPGKHVPTK